MFQIDDAFLESVGFDVAHLDDAKKQQYIDQFTTEVNDRVSDRLVSELDDQQIEEFNDIQNNRDRTHRWLAEFHADYRDTDEYQALRENVGDDDDAAQMYATALWMNDAVPQYGELIQEELSAYHDELLRIRQAANAAAGKV